MNLPTDKPAESEGFEVAGRLGTDPGPQTGIIKSRVLRPAGTTTAFTPQALAQKLADATSSTVDQGRANSALSARSATLSGSRQAHSSDDAVMLRYTTPNPSDKQMIEFVFGSTLSPPAFEGWLVVTASLREQGLSEAQIAARLASYMPRANPYSVPDVAALVDSLYPPSLAAYANSGPLAKAQLVRSFQARRLSDGDAISHAWLAATLDVFSHIASTVPAIAVPSGKYPMLWNNPYSPGFPRSEKISSSIGNMYTADFDFDATQVVPGVVQARDGFLTVQKNGELRGLAENCGQTYLCSLSIGNGRAWYVLNEIEPNTHAFIGHRSASYAVIDPSAHVITQADGTITYNCLTFQHGPIDVDTGQPSPPEPLLSFSITPSEREEGVFEAQLNGTPLLLTRQWDGGFSGRVVDGTHPGYEVLVGPKQFDGSRSIMFERPFPPSSSNPKSDRVKFAAIFNPGNVLDVDVPVRTLAEQVNDSLVASDRLLIPPGNYTLENAFRADTTVPTRTLVVLAPTTPEQLEIVLDGIPITLHPEGEGLLYYMTGHATIGGKLQKVELRGKHLDIRDGLTRPETSNAYLSVIPQQLQPQSAFDMLFFMGSRNINRELAAKLFSELGEPMPTFSWEPLINLARQQPTAALMRAALQAQMPVTQGVEFAARVYPGPETLELGAVFEAIRQQTGTLPHVRSAIEWMAMVRELVSKHSFDTAQLVAWVAAKIPQGQSNYQVTDLLATINSILPAEFLPLMKKRFAVLPKFGEYQSGSTGSLEDDLVKTLIKRLMEPDASHAEVVARLASQLDVAARYIRKMSVLPIGSFKTQDGKLLEGQTPPQNNLYDVTLNGVAMQLRGYPLSPGRFDGQIIINGVGHTVTLREIAPYGPHELTVTSNATPFGSSQSELTWT